MALLFLSCFYGNATGKDSFLRLNVTIFVLAFQISIVQVSFIFLERPLTSGAATAVVAKLPLPLKIICKA